MYKKSLPPRDDIQKPVFHYLISIDIKSNVINFIVKHIQRIREEG